MLWENATHETTRHRTWLTKQHVTACLKKKLLGGKTYIRCYIHFWVGFPSHFNLHENRVVNIDEMCKWGSIKTKFGKLYICKQKVTVTCEGYTPHLKWDEEIESPTNIGKHEKKKKNWINKLFFFQINFKKYFFNSKIMAPKNEIRKLKSIRYREGNVELGCREDFFWLMTSQYGRG